MNEKIRRDHFKDGKRLGQIFSDLTVAIWRLSTRLEIAEQK